MAFEHLIVPALATAVVLLLLLAIGRRARGGRRKGMLEALDTVMAWTPESTRVMTKGERDAYQLLVQALPDHIVLAQVTLARFLKVPRRQSYGEWVNRVGRHAVDLLVCNEDSSVVAVVEVHSADDSERARQRHERMARVLKAANVRVIVWNEGALPDMRMARAMVLPDGAKRASDSGFDDTQPRREPPPSTWFDEFDSSPAPLAQR